LRRAYGKVWTVGIRGSSGDGVAGFLNAEFAEDTERIEKKITQRRRVNRGFAEKSEEIRRRRN
jgi:hypothetical protein